MVAYVHELDPNMYSQPTYDYPPVNYTNYVPPLRASQCNFADELPEITESEPFEGLEAQQEWLKGKGCAKIVHNVRLAIQKVFTEGHVPDHHGLQHADAVHSHMMNALNEPTVNVTKERRLALQLAAYVHDCDDRKYFSNTSNVVKVLDRVLGNSEEFSEIKMDVKLMVSLVSTTTNGVTVPPSAEKDPMLLWPRFCDRLESIGVPGIIRNWEYSAEMQVPVYTESTPRPTTKEGVWEAVTKKRFTEYQLRGGTSATVIEHE